MVLPLWILNQKARALDSHISIESVPTSFEVEFLDRRIARREETRNGYGFGGEGGKGTKRNENRLIDYLDDREERIEYIDHLRMIVAILLTNFTRYRTLI